MDRVIISLIDLLKPKASHIAELLKYSVHNIDISSNFGSKAHSLLSIFEIKSPPKLTNQLIDLSSEELNLLMKAIHTLYPVKDDSPEIVEIRFMTIAGQNDTDIIMEEIRKDFEEINKELYRAQLIAKKLSTLDISWVHNKHNEDFEKIYDLPFHLMCPLEQIYNEGRPFGRGLKNALLSFNDISQHTSIVTWTENLENNWINQKQNYELLAQKAEQTQINITYHYNSINQMLDTLRTQIKILDDVHTLIKSIKRKPLYIDELGLESLEDSNVSEMSNRTIKILFLGANPLNEIRLRIDKEIREIEGNLKNSQLRDRLNIKSEWAVTTSSLQQALLDENPTIVQFSGHGSCEGIAIEDNDGNSKLIENDALGSLFDLFSDKIECIFLNSCHSETQAKIIAKHIPYVIGMNNSVPDEAAIAFSIGFYKAIGAGKDFEFAYKLGVSSIELEGIEGSDIPVLFKKTSFK